MADVNIATKATVTPTTSDSFLTVRNVDGTTARVTIAALKALLDTYYYLESEVDTLLDGKAEVVHGHVIADTTGLQTALDGKSSTAHTHTSTAVTNFNEAVDDRVAALLVAGTNITLTYNDVSNTLTIDAAGGGGGVTDHGALTGLADDDHTQYLTEARASALHYTHGEVDILLADKSDLGHTHTAANVTDFNEAVDDRVNGLLVAGTNVTLTYNDAGNTLTIASSGGGSGEPALGNPAEDGMVLSSTTAGTRSWIALPSGTAGGGLILIASNDAPTVVKNSAMYVCDGTDDHVQINAALALAGTYGLEVKLSAGRFFVREPIVMDKTNGGFTLAGSGASDGYTRGGTTISVHTSGFPTGRAIIESGLQNYNPGNTIRDITVDGRNQTYSVIHGIHSASYAGYLDHVVAIDCSGWGFKHGNLNASSVLRAATDTRIIDCKVKNCALGGHTSSGGSAASTDMHWINCLVFNLPSTATAGIYLASGTGGAHVIGGQIYDCQCPGIHLESILATITGMKIENNNHGIYINGGRGASITGVTFRANSNTTDNTYDNIHVNAGSYISITGGRNVSNNYTGTPQNPVRYGVYLNSGTSYIGIHNMLFDVYGAGTWGTAKALNNGTNNSIHGPNYP
jgi:hypothetical protein